MVGYARDVDKKDVSEMDAGGKHCGYCVQHFKEITTSMEKHAAEPSECAEAEAGGEISEWMSSDIPEGIRRPSSIPDGASVVAKI